MHVLGSYVEGCRLVTDLLGTVAGYRLDDRLVTIDDLDVFGREHGLDRCQPLRSADVAAARGLRDELAVAVDSGSAPRVIAICSAMVAACPHSVQFLDRGEFPWAVHPGPDTRLVERMQLVAGLSVIAVVDRLGIDRLRDCQHGPCTGRFVDTSSNGRRKFCIPEICGNRTNVQRYRRRHARA